MVFSYIKTHKTAINRLQTCTEAATKYYNYTVNETDEERNTDCPDCRPFQKRRDWIRPRIRQRLKFTVKIIFFDAAIGSKNYALQEYLSKDSGPPIGLYTMSNNGFYSKLYFTMNSLEQR